MGKVQRTIKGLISKQIMESSKSTSYRKPIDRWLQSLGIAVGVAFFLLPKTQLVVVACIVLMFVCLVHPIWRLPWIERRGHRRVIAVVIYGSLLTLLGYYVWPEYYLPWLATNGTVVDKGNTTGLIVRFIVRTNSKFKTILPNNPIHNLRIDLSTPIARSDADGWNECTLAHIGPLPIWSNRDLTLGNLGVLALSRNL